MPTCATLIGGRVISNGLTAPLLIGLRFRRPDYPEVSQAQRSIPWKWTSKGPRSNLEGGLVGGGRSHSFAMRQSAMNRSRSSMTTPPSLEPPGASGYFRKTRRQSTAARGHAFAQIKMAHSPKAFRFTTRVRHAYPSRRSNGQLFLFGDPQLQRPPALRQRVLRLRERLALDAIRRRRNRLGPHQPGLLEHVRPQAGGGVSADRLRRPVDDRDRLRLDGDRASVGVKARWATFGSLSKEATFNLVRSHIPVQADGVDPFTSTFEFDGLAYYTVTVNLKCRL